MRYWLPVLLVLTAYAQDDAHTFMGKPHPLQIVVMDVGKISLPRTSNYPAPEEPNVYVGTLYVHEDSMRSIPMTFTCRCKLVPGVTYWARFAKVDKSGKMESPGKLEVILTKGKRQWEETVEYR